MRTHALLFAVAALVLSIPAMAQDTLPSCASFLSAAEIRSTCGVSDFVFETSPDRETTCQITAQRNGSVSALTVNVSTQDNAEAARMSVEVARAIGKAADDSRETGGDPGDGAEMMGQVFEMLGVQEEGAAEVEGVSDAEATSRDLPALGDGGVRYVSEAAAGLGLVTHTVVFSSGAVLVKVESGIVADRAGVCTVETLEPLARLVADRH